jgi:hypothetical protein
MFDLTPGFRLYARYRRRQIDRTPVAAAQERNLLRLVRRAAETRFGREHAFGQIAGVRDFQNRVPVRDYKDFWTDYWQRDFPVLKDLTWPGLIPYFALTSGTTTGTSKYIPYTAEMIADGQGGMRDLFVHHISERPQSRLFGGKGLMLGGTTDLEELTTGVRAGDLSGIAAENVPWWLSRRVVPSREIALMPDWSDKIARLAPMSLQHDIRCLGGNPNWLLLFFDQVAKTQPHQEARLASWYPNLEVVVHGGVNFVPYRRRFSELLTGSHAETREAYSASEAFIAAADRGDGEGLRVVSDRGVFYEFVPTSELGSARPTRHWLANIETDVEYAVLVTTPAGVWAYMLGDTVRFVDRDPPRLVVTGRTSYRLSVFGEHVIGEEIEAAVAAAADAIDEAVTDYAVGAFGTDGSDTSGQEGDPAGRGHFYVVECARMVREPRQRDTFAQVLDRRLCQLNDDYDSQRRNDYGLKPPKVRFVPPGTFAAWMKRRRQLGGQHKVPRIITDEALFSDLREFISKTERGE